jgi:CRP-like cAMP-binding protein
LKIIRSLKHFEAACGIGLYWSLLAHISTNPFVVLFQGKGEYFGEIALLSGQPRKASVYAVGKAVCFYITRPTFKRILGPLQSFLEGNMDKYAKYQDAMKEAAGEQLDEERDAHEDEALHSSAKQEKKPKAAAECAQIDCLPKFWWFS